MTTCAHCRQLITPNDRLEMESRTMQEAFTAMSLEGLSFHYYSCSWCGHDNLYVAITRLQGETKADFGKRKAALAEACAEVNAERTSIVLMEEAF